MTRPPSWMCLNAGTASSPVIEDRDRAKMKELGFIKALEIPVSDPMGGGRKDVAQAEVGNGHGSPLLTEALSEEEIERRVAERNAARDGVTLPRPTRSVTELLQRRCYTGRYESWNPMEKKVRHFAHIVPAQVAVAGAPRSLWWRLTLPRSSPQSKHPENTGRCTRQRRGEYSWSKTSPDQDSTSGSGSAEDRSP